MEKYHKYFENSSEGIVIFDETYTIVDINKRALILLSKEKSKIISKNISLLMEKNPLFDKFLKSLKQTLEVVNLHLKDKEKTLNVIISAKVYDGYGFIRFTDMHELSALESEIQLEQSMNLLGLMARGIAHDFNNLLMGISGSINLLILDSKNLNNPQRKFLFDAQKALFQAAALVKQFQYLTRDDEPKNIKIDLYSAVKNVFSFLERTSSKVVEKIINFEPNTYYVLADPILLNQVILNLANNSINAMGDIGSKSGYFIKVEASFADETTIIERDLGSSKVVHIVFEDNGRGIPEKDLSKIFLPFYTSEDTSKSSMKGLSLSITHDIITRQFLGSIHVESEVNIFTKVHIFIPSPEDILSYMDQDFLSQEILTGTETILIADDEQSVRNVLTISLQKLGYTVKSVTNGEDCVNLYRNEKEDIDLILLDITMPKMSGVEVMNNIYEFDPNCKIIISSGHTEEEIHKGILSKAQGHLNKPYLGDELAKMIRFVLDD